MKKTIFAVCLGMVSGFTAYAQSSAAKVDYFSAQDIQKQLADLDAQAQASGGSGSTLGEYANHQLKLSVRSSSGGAEMHAHYADVFYVTQGKATLITGGSITGAKTDDSGETKGSEITGGSTRMISVGDVVNIPPGTPHQLKIAQGTTYSAIVIKVKTQ